jgi:hypothetical protein
VSLSNPMRRRAAFTVFSLIGRSLPRALGNTYSPRPVSGCSSRRISAACAASGTMCGVLVLLVWCSATLPHPDRYRSSAHAVVRQGEQTPAVQVSTQPRPQAFHRIRVMHAARALPARVRSRWRSAPHAVATMHLASPRRGCALRARSRWHSGTPAQPRCGRDGRFLRHRGLRSCKARPAARALLCRRGQQHGRCYVGDGQVADVRSQVFFQQTAFADRRTGRQPLCALKQ